MTNFVQNGLTAEMLPALSGEPKDMDAFILFMDGIEVDREVVHCSERDLGVKFVSPTRSVKPIRQIAKGIRW